MVLVVQTLASCGPRAASPVAPRTRACIDETDPIERAACAARRELASARAENDAVKVVCETDKAAQIDALRRSRIERRGEPRFVAILERKADELLYEVEHCVCVDP